MLTGALGSWWALVYSSTSFAALRSPSASREGERMLPAPPLPEWVNCGGGLARERGRERERRTLLTLSPITGNSLPLEGEKSSGPFPLTTGSLESGRIFPAPPLPLEKTC